MNTPHTSEPWEFVSAGRGTVGGRMEVTEFYVRVPGDDVAIACDIVDPTTGQPSEQNARRIAACVNACAGIPVECLESGAPLKSGDDEARELAKLREDLALAVARLGQADELLAKAEKRLQYGDRITPKTVYEDESCGLLVTFIRQHLDASAAQEPDCKPMFESPILCRGCFEQVTDRAHFDEAGKCNAGSGEAL